MSVGKLKEWMKLGFFQSQFMVMVVGSYLEFIKTISRLKPVAFEKAEAIFPLGFFRMCKSASSTIQVGLGASCNLVVGWPNIRIHLVIALCKELV